MMMMAIMRTMMNRRKKRRRNRVVLMMKGTKLLQHVFLTWVWIHTCICICFGLILCLSIYIACLIFLHFFPSKTLKPKRIFIHGFTLFHILDYRRTRRAVIPWRVFPQTSSGRSAGLTTVEMTNLAVAMTALEGGVRRVNIAWRLVLKLWLEGQIQNQKSNNRDERSVLPLVFFRGFGICAIHWETSNIIFVLDFLLFSEKNVMIPNETIGIQFCHFFCWLGKLKKRLLPVFGKVNPMASELEIQIQEIIPQVARNIAQMDVTNPEVLRVTRAFSAFQHFAEALRVGCDGDFYHKSFKSHKISTFWSHSWHGGYWKKILTLLALYNGPAALFCGFLTAIVMAILFWFGILPGIDRGWAGLQFSPWCLHSGFVVTIVVMIFWRSPTRVFLDRICISQNDHDLKTQAIFSLAGLLKNSEAMLILWDPTWTEAWISFGKSTQILVELYFLLDTNGYGGFLKWWYPTTMGFPTKNDHFGVFWGTIIFGNTHMFQHLFCDIGNSKPKERLWCLFELAAFLKSKKMTSGKQRLIVKPLFLGPISIAIFSVTFVIGLPLTTLSLYPSATGIFVVVPAGLLSGLVVGYPTVAGRLFNAFLTPLKYQL